MATLNIGYTFVNATPAVASQVNSNFQDVKTFAEGISTGTNIDAGAIELSKLSNAAIQQLTPSGSIMQYAGTAAPTGWILCDGTAVSTTTYAALFAVIGSAFNTSGGQTAPSAGTFRVPLLTGRIPVGRDAGNAAFDVLGETGGSQNVTLSLSNLPSHQHTDGTLAAASSATGIIIQNDGAHGHSGTAVAGGDHAHTTPMLYHVGGATSHAHTRSDYYSGGPGNFDVVLDARTTAVGGNHGHTLSINTSATHSHAVVDSQHSHDVTGLTGLAGNSTAHENLQPYIVVNYIIKA
jgi:microcystin-dependent protein